MEARNNQMATNLLTGDTLGDQIKICRLNRTTAAFAGVDSAEEACSIVKETAMAMGVPNCLS